MPTQPHINQQDENRFIPHTLPKSGFDLIEGFQYVLSPVARSVIDDVYGIKNVPKYVECVRSQRDEVEFFSRQTNLRTGEVIERSFVQEGCQAVFRGLTGNKKFVKFELDLEFVHERAAAYATGDDADATLLLKEVKKEYQEKKTTRSSSTRSSSGRSSAIDIASLF